MTNRPLRFAALAASSFLVLAACATTGSKRPDAGQRISARGEAISARGDAWQGGQKDVRKGEQLVARSAGRNAAGEEKLKLAREDAAEAERDIQFAQSDHVRGEQLIADGTAQMQRAEDAYAELRRRPSAVGTQD